MKTPRSRAPEAQRSGAPRLEELLRHLPERGLEQLVQRLGIAIDPQKRIDPPAQVARVLVLSPELRNPALLEGPSRELLYRIAEANGVLDLPALPTTAEPLMERGLVFARQRQRGVELVLPIAFLLVLRPWEGDDPRGVRALLAQASQDVGTSIATQYLGRPATPPLSLSLEPAWEALMDEARLKADLDALAPAERKLLRAIEKGGGEVDTEELLELEREPLRLRGAAGATPSRRGIGFALERRGFLVPVHPNRHIIPTEVAAAVGAVRRADREAQRREVHSRVLGADHAPRRARFARDPAPLALALAMSTRDPGVEIRPDVGTSKSLLGRLSTRFGRDPETVAMIAALSRAVGLWDPSADLVTASPGALTLTELGRALFLAWRRGGAWDEARPDGELLRVPAEAREASPIGPIREMVVDALRELGDGQWAPWEAVAVYVTTDSRTPGLGRLLERWASRAGVEASTPLQVAERMTLDSLHQLGLVDVGEPEPIDVEFSGPTVRLTPRGRAFLREQPLSSIVPPGMFTESAVLRVGGGSQVGHVLACAPFTEFGVVDDVLQLDVTPQAIALALAAGLETSAIRGHLEALAPLPEPVQRLLTQTGAVLGRAEYVATGGFLWVDDPEIRGLLSTRKQTMDLFIDPSPAGGLLLVPGMDLDAVARRARGLGIEILVDGEVFRARTIVPGRRSSTSVPAAPRPPSTAPGSGRRSSGALRRTGSSQSLAAAKRRS